MTWFFHVSSKTSTSTVSSPGFRLYLSRHPRLSTAIRTSRQMASDSPSARARSGDALEIWTAASDGSERASADTSSRQLEVFAGVVTRRPTRSRSTPKRRTETGISGRSMLTAASRDRSPTGPAARMYRHGRGTGTGFISRGTRETDATSGARTSRTDQQSRSRTGERVGSAANRLMGRASGTNSTLGDAALVAQPLTGGEPRTIIQCVTRIRYTPSLHRASTTFRVRTMLHPDSDPTASRTEPCHPPGSPARNVGEVRRIATAALRSHPMARRFSTLGLVSRGADLMLIQNFR